MKEKSKCYACDNLAVSKEHVPPRCLFPEKKDIKGIDFRKGLIKVPSCDLHNSKKSSDDEFLMFSLAGLINNNFVGQMLHTTKIPRALKRKSETFISDQVLRNHEFKTIKSSNNKTKIASIGQPNFDRLIDCFEHIAYGLYYYEFKNTFEGDIAVIMDFLEYEDKDFVSMVKIIKKMFNSEKALNQIIKGENREVFTYQFMKPDKDGLIALKTVFYGSAEVYFSFKPKAIKQSFDLARELMKNGIKTIFEFGDESFTIN